MLFFGLGCTAWDDAASWHLHLLLLLLQAYYEPNDVRIRNDGWPSGLRAPHFANASFLASFCERISMDSLLIYLKGNWLILADPWTFATLTLLVSNATLLLMPTASFVSCALKVPVFLFPISPNHRQDSFVAHLLSVLLFHCSMPLASHCVRRNNTWQNTSISLFLDFENI